MMQKLWAEKEHAKKRNVEDDGKREKRLTDDMVGFQIFFFFSNFFILPASFLKLFFEPLFPPPPPMSPHVLVDFVVFPSGHSRNVTDF